MAEMPSNNQAIKETYLISQRITQHFHPHTKARYQILVVNNRFDQVFNFFFELQRSSQLPHSFPLHQVTYYDLAFLEKIIQLLQAEYGFTFTFRNFTGLFWPSTQQKISKHFRFKLANNLFNKDNLANNNSQNS
ncbi:MAG: acetyl-CoA carboxylase [Liquorilactobacillus nagelii]|uniref:Acetyl-CoA carboxylase n=1 Tax=Liquorilactobacillus nagelii TaxID=82688 RepID=A0A3Q8CP13_9LACO|nr:acetyl-CoA carboxylase [Liquorilactobacillus nagelii]AUJ32079.1 hypothetical protein BSQ50_05625 [Liquorilactobacillus nagelii]MCC7615237.1 acetyl-CoA carboxylase [Liquorilactobacillus nagelii]MCP9315515.1 acetyl-CoA carboxylase [Liquorilactobacillus nagelii]ULQ49593.1 acetyl-CoA carboxylase [Liquorilactobacillus nagelii]